MTERDQRDSSRDDSPLRQMPDAVVVDTGDRTIEDVVKHISSLVRATRDSS
ncbi:MAG: (d)CMP kinase [Ilumatobacteraceae bacterium]